MGELLQGTEAAAGFSSQGIKYNFKAKIIIAQRGNTRLAQARPGLIPSTVCTHAH